MASGFCLEIVSKKNGKIKGGSKSKACPDQIEVASWSWGGVAGNRSGAKASTQTVELHEATFTCPMSIAASALFHAAITGDEIKTATLSARAEGANGDEIIYMQFRFNDALLTSYNASGEGSGHPQQVFTIDFSGVEVLYCQQKPDGAVGQSRQAAYDSSTNAMVKPTLGS